MSTMNPIVPLKRNSEEWKKVNSVYQHIGFNLRHPQDSPIVNFDDHNNVPILQNIATGELRLDTDKLKQTHPTCMDPSNGDISMGQLVGILCDTMRAVQARQRKLLRRVQQLEEDMDVLMEDDIAEECDDGEGEEDEDIVDDEDEEEDDSDGCTDRTPKK